MLAFNFFILNKNFIHSHKIEFFLFAVALSHLKIMKENEFVTHILNNVQEEGLYDIDNKELLKGIAYIRYLLNTRMLNI